MLDSLSRRLTALIITVFLFLTTFFSITVYWWISHQFEAENKRHLETFTRAISTSIEPPDEEANEHSAKNERENIPDVLEQHETSANEHNIGLQWFNNTGKLLASKGGLAFTLPLSNSARFQMQRSPHAVLLIEPVVRNGKTIGYLRTGLSMDSADLSDERLRNGLAFGILSSIGVSALATWLIVQEALKPTRKVFDQLSQFTADASHELKSPITAIKMNADVLAQYSHLGDQELNLVEAIANAAQQMNMTVQDLLMLARVDSVENRLSGQANVAQLINDATEELKFFTEQKRIAIVIQIDNPNLKIAANYADIKRVLTNLIKNAIQYSSNDSEVRICAKSTKFDTIIEVQDFGVGIKQEDQPKIFDRFWRADKARSNGTGGSGLGLSIAKSIVQRYRGTIAVTSKLGEGSTFKVLLPIA